jgi:hypothetical protein
VAGYDVAVLRVSATDAATGVLQGTTLAFDSFHATAEVKLTDGRYDYLPISTGALLARWDVVQNRFVIAFSFSATTAEGDEIDLNGTAFGEFNNTAPNAVVAIVSPTPRSESESSAIFECQSPQGTDVELSSDASSDREDGKPKSVWFDSHGTLLGTAEQLSLSDLAVDTITDLQLMVYDSGGFAQNQPYSLSVVDTLAPVIDAGDICLWPPNHNAVSVRLGREIRATAIDMCEGDLSSAIQITNVTSSHGGGVVSWSATGACLAAARDGSGKDTRTYAITLQAADSKGNIATRIVNVSVPHDQRERRACLQTSTLESCE